MRNLKRIIIILLVIALFLIVLCISLILNNKNDKGNDNEIVEKEYDYEHALEEAINTRFYYS